MDELIAEDPFELLTKPNGSLFSLACFYSGCQSIIYEQGTKQDVVRD